MARKRNRKKVHTHALRDFSFPGCFISVTAEAICMANKFAKHTDTYHYPKEVAGAIASAHYYHSKEEKIASIVRAIIKNHYFPDGNKRTGLLVCVALCELNGLRIKASNLGKVMEEIATLPVSVEDVADIIFQRV